MKRKIVAVPAVAAVVAGAWLALASPASAHDANVVLKCDSASVHLSNYKDGHGRHEDNSVTVKVNGHTVKHEDDFGSSFNWSASLDGKDGNRLQVDVDAWDSSAYDVHFDQTTSGCETTPTPTATVTVTKSVPGPTATVTQTITHTVHVPGPTVTNTVTEHETVTATATSTVSVAVPGPTQTVQVSGPTQLVTQPAVTATVEKTVAGIAAEHLVKVTVTATKTAPCAALSQHPVKESGLAMTGSNVMGLGLLGGALLLLGLLFLGARPKRGH